MKLSIPSIALLTSIIGQTNAFSHSPAFFKTQQSSSTSLFASRNADKIASRSAWAEARGMSADVEEESSLLTNEHGLEYVKLVNGDSSAEIYLYGGVVTSYIKDDVEYIAVRPDAKTDGSKPISGGLSHCWPQVCVTMIEDISLYYCVNDFFSKKGILLAMFYIHHSLIIIKNNVLVWTR